MIEGKEIFRLILSLIVKHEKLLIFSMSEKHVFCLSVTFFNATEKYYPLLVTKFKKTKKSIRYILLMTKLLCLDKITNYIKVIKITFGVLYLPCPTFRC